MKIDLNRIDASDADPKVKEVYRLLKKYMDQPERKQWLKTRDDCWDAVYESGEKSTIWTEEERNAMEKKGMVPLTINDLYKGVQGSAAVVTDQKPGITFLPVGSGDLYVAELMKRAHDQVWNQNDGGTEIYEAVKEAKIGGMGLLISRHDPAKGIYGKVVFGNDTPDSLYYDMQEAKKADLSDTHILIARLVTKSYAKDTYEDVTDEDMIFGEQYKPDDRPTQDTVTGADNYTIGIGDNPPIGPADYPQERKDVWEIEAHLLQRERELWLMIPGQNGEFNRQVFTTEQKADAELMQKFYPGSVLWKRVVEKRLLRIIVGRKLVKQVLDGVETDELVNPYGVDVDGDPVLPVVVLSHDRTRKGKPVAPTVFAKEACRERNKRRPGHLRGQQERGRADHHGRGDEVAQGPGSRRLGGGGQGESMEAGPAHSGARICRGDEHGGRCEGRRGRHVRHARRDARQDTPPAIHPEGRSWPYRTWLG
jgi:hypothetical protein